MAKLQDKLFNRAIEGKLDLENGDLKPSDVAGAIAGGNVDNAKPIYWHTLDVSRNYTSDDPAVSMFHAIVIILNNNNTPITAEMFQNMLKTEGFICVVHSGVYKPTGAEATFKEVVDVSYRNGSEYTLRYYSDDKRTINIVNHFVDNFVVTELGNNKIN